jgi:PhzF family phenazine biosynthesis protein
MKYTIYQVDAFAEKLFSGNPAAVIPLTEWLPDDLLLSISAENNLSETAYYVIKENSVEIRWFTPNTEVDLCGHATLATAYVLKTQENFSEELIPFYSHRSGPLPVTSHGHLFTMSFPIDNLTEVELTNELLSTTNHKPVKAFKGKSDYMLIFNDQQEIEKLSPNLSAIEKLDARGLIVTAKGNDCDFVSRFFGPQCGVNEDPVTGSAHTSLTPYWAEQFGKNEHKAIQVSSRRGKLSCKLINERVEITGQAVLYMKGQIEL